MVVTIQVQLDHHKEFSAQELAEIEGEMNTLCSKLGKYSYIRAQFCVDGRSDWKELKEIFDASSSNKS